MSRTAGTSRYFARRSRAAAFAHDAHPSADVIAVEDRSGSVDPSGVLLGEIPSQASDTEVSQMNIYFARPAQGFRYSAGY